MKTMTLEAEITPDGTLHLDIPSALPPGKVQVVLVLQPLADAQPPYSSLEGSWKEYFPPDFDLDGALHEIRHEWEEEWEAPS